MPIVAKCPNCNGPLDKAPTGPEQKCPYCGATLLATRYMPAADAAAGTPPAMPGPFVPPGSPGWGTAPTGAPGGFTPPSKPWTVPQPVAAHVRRSATGAIVSVVVSLVITGGVAAAVFLAQREVSDRTEQAMSSANQAMAQRNAAVNLTPRTLEPGKAATIDLPSSSDGPGGHVFVTLNVSLAEETPFEVSMTSDSVIASCRIKALDAADKALARSGEFDSKAQIYPVLPQGASKILVDCDSHPAERTITVLARPLPIVLPGQQALIVIEPGMESAGAIVVPDAAGPYAVALLCDDSSTHLQLLGEGDTLVGKADLNSSAGRAVLEEQLQVTGYLVQAVYSSTASQKIPATIALTSLAPEPLALGIEVTGTMTRWAPQRYYSLNLAAEGKIVVTLNSEAFDHTVEIQRADGVPVAASEEASAGSRARVAPSVPLAIGEYRIIVRGDEYQLSEGDYRLKVDAVVEEAPPPTKRRGRPGSN
jgi:hypothetical protein